MGLLSTEVEITLSGKNIKYFEDLGYEIPRYYHKQMCKWMVKKGTKIKVKVPDLQENSSVMVDIECDCCKTHYDISYYRYNKINHDGNIYCIHCASSVLNSKENHPNWNFDKTDEDRIKDRDRHRSDDFSKNVLARDDYTCQCCGQKHGNIIAHHLNGYNWFKEGRYDESNGVTLCENCHMNFHSCYGYGDNTKEQYEEWIGYAIEGLKKYDGILPIARQVIDMDNLSIIGSAVKASLLSNSSEHHVRACCNRKSKQCKGFHFLWLDTYEKMTEQDIKDYWEWVDCVGKKVICLPTFEIFNNYRLGAEHYNIGIARNISRTCLKNIEGKLTYCGTLTDGTKLTWVYLDDYNNMGKPQIESILYEINRQKIICLTTMKVFGSRAAAKNFYNIKDLKTANCFSGKQKTSGKLKDGTPLAWMKYDDYLRLTDKEKQELENKYKIESEVA